MSKIQKYINYIADPRARRSVRSLFSHFMFDDEAMTFRDIVFGNGIDSNTTPITLAGAFTTGISMTGAGTTPVSITGAFTTGISIAADGTTAISVTSAFTGVTGISLAGTGSTAGINISGNHTTAITIGAQTTGGVAITGATATGILITGACSTAAMQIGVSGTPAGDFLWYGTTALYKVLFDADGDTNGAVYIGADTKGLMFKLYGDIIGCGVFWDPSSDTNGALSIGASGGSKGVNVTMYGATIGCSLAWDQSADSLEVVKTSAIATATNLYSVNIGQTLTGASAVNTAEVLRSVLTSNVQVGNWANAILGKIDFSTAGFVTGLAGAVCAELDMPAATIGNGSYCCFEAELGVPTGALGFGTTVPVAFLTGNAWGDGVAEFRDDGYIFNFTGLGAATAAKVFDECTAAAASHALRILIDGVPYYIMLNVNVDA